MHFQNIWHAILNNTFKYIKYELTYFLWPIQYVGSVHSELLTPIPLFLFRVLSELLPLCQAHANTHLEAHTHILNTHTPTNRVTLLHSLSSHDPECLATFNCTEILCTPYKVAVASHVTDNLHAAGREFT